MQRRQRGFTLTELILTTALLMIFVTGSINVYVMIQNLWKEERERITIQSERRLGLDSMLRKIRGGVETNIFDNGNRLQVRLDPSRTPADSSDDVTCEYKLNGSNIVYTPNINHPVNNKTIISNVYKDGMTDIFTKQGTLITITFMVKSPSLLSGYRLIGSASAAKTRNG